jgi:hypothetical protein
LVLQSGALKLDDLEVTTKGWFLNHAFHLSIRKCFYRKSDAENALQCQNTCAISLTLWNKTKEDSYLKQSGRNEQKLQLIQDH